MFLAPSAKSEVSVVVLAYFLPKALKNFVTSFGDIYAP